MQQQQWKNVMRGMVIILGIFIGCFLILNESLAIQPGTESGQTEPGETVPTVPGERPERPIPSSQPAESRAITEYPRPPSNQTQRVFVDAFLPKSVWHVTDPQDGLRKDGRVAVLEGLNAQVVYHFYKDHRVLNVPNEPDLIIYTHDKGGVDGPYNVFVANFGDSTWTQLGANAVGTSSFDLPPSLESIELVLIINQNNGATYIEAIEGIALAGGDMQGTFTYAPETLIGLRAPRLDCQEVERARTILTGSRIGYQLMPLGEIEVQWNDSIKNEWKKEEFHIEAEGEYEVYASDSRAMENFIGRRAGAQSIDLPQNMTDATRVRIRNHNNNRPVMIYAILGRR